MGQCLGKSSLKNLQTELKFSQCQFPIREYGDFPKYTTENSFQSNNKISRFEKVLKEGEDTDFRLIDNCKTIQKPTIYVSKQENSLYSKQTGLIELLNLRSKNSVIELKKKNRISILNNFHSRIDQNSRFSKRVYLKFKSLIESKKYNRSVFRSSHLGKKFRIKNGCKYK